VSHIADDLSRRPTRQPWANKRHAGQHNRLLDREIVAGNCGLGGLSRPGYPLAANDYGIVSNRKGWDKLTQVHTEVGMGTASRLLVFFIAAAVLVSSPVARAAEEVDLLLVLSSDISRSIDAQKFKLQRDGYAAAIVNPRVIQAIRSGSLGKIAISFVEWSSFDQQQIVIDWTVIRDEATAKDFSAQIIKAPRAFRDRTSISGGIDFAVAQLALAPFHANRHTIDVSGDGTHNSGRDVTDARDEALAKGVTINGLVILSEQTISNATHSNPPGGLDAYYRNNVIGGAGAFVMVAENFSSFGKTIVTKLSAEITSKPTR
jgi:hypothetical protein